MTSSYSPATTAIDTTNQKGSSSSTNNKTPAVHTPLVNDSNGCIVSLYEHVLSQHDAESWLQELAETLPWKVEQDNFGPQSRPTCYFGDTNCVFSYVGLVLEPKPWPPSLDRLRSLVTQTCGGARLLTACLVNHYPQGRGHIPWHYDEVRAHGTQNLVASLSLGGPRRFQLRKRDTNQVVYDQLLSSGSVLWMQGKTQEYYEHCLPLDENESNPHRISITFRSIVPGYEQGREIAADQCCTDTADKNCND